MNAPIQYYGGKNTMSKCKMLISGYDNDKYNVLIDNGFNKVSFTTNNRVETLWRNY